MRQGEGAVQPIEFILFKLKKKKCLDDCFPFFSFGDISAAAMFQDIDKLMIGILMMFVYIQAMFQHRYSWVDCRVSLTDRK